MSTCLTPRRAWRLSVLAAGALAAASALPVHAQLVSGTLDPVAGIGLDVIDFTLSAPGTLGIGVMGVPGSAVSLASLFGPGGAPITATSFFPLPAGEYKTFLGLSAGSYSIALTGLADAAYNLSFLPSPGTTVSVVPEPQSLALALAGVGVAGALARRRLAA